MLRQLSVTLLLIGSVPASAGKPSVTPADFIARMDKSPRTYRIESEKEPNTHWTQQNAMLTWPEEHPPLDVPVMVNGHLEPWQHEPGAFEELEAVEVLYEAKKFAEAEAGYKKVLEKHPRDYLAELGYGDAALMAGRPKDALGRYEAAIKLCPVDHRGWYYKGNALFALGKKAEAIDAYVRALALRPRHTPMLLGLENRAPRLGLQVRDDNVLPRARVETAGEAIVLHAVTSPPWLAWAFCKAVWLGEPSFRKEVTGSEAKTFSMEEERQCLINAAAVWLSRKKDDPDEPGVARIAEVAQARLLDGLIIYEIASRHLPNVAATLTEKELAVVEQYVRKYVLVPTETR